MDRNGIFLCICLGAMPLLGAFDVPQGDWCPRSDCMKFCCRGCCCCSRDTVIVINNDLRIVEKASADAIISMPLPLPGILVKYREPQPEKIPGVPARHKKRKKSVHFEPDGTDCRAAQLAKDLAAAQIAKDMAFLERRVDILEKTWLSVDEFLSSLDLTSVSDDCPIKTPSDPL